MLSLCLRASVVLDGSVLEVSCVAFDELFLGLGNVFEGENRIRSAGRDAGAAVDTLHGIDKELSGRFETGLVLLGMDAVDRANIDAEGVLDAGIGDYIGHGKGLRDEIVGCWFNSIVSVGAVSRAGL